LAVEHFRQHLANLEDAGLRRKTIAWPGTGGKIRLQDGRTLLNFSSNDYLNLAQDPHVKCRATQAIQRWGCGATASRLMCGTLTLHEELEAALARLLGQEAALVFSSGFGMNLGLVSAVAGRGDVLFSDELNHASLIDGMRLSRALVKRFRHNDTQDLEQLLATTPSPGHRFIVCESVFSMDGDLAPLPALRELASRYQATLLVDEAHAIGIFGGGGGLWRDFRAAPDGTLIMGTLSKALGSLGGFVACGAVARDFLVNRARSFIYATALAPASVAAALGALERIQTDPGMGTRLLHLAREFHQQLKAQGLRVGNFHSQIIPVHIGDNQRTMALAERLRNRGLLVTGIRPPTVPRHTARLRLSVTLAHSADDLARAATEIGKAARELGAV
jgi:8-amino-7-oxononanoate synthase